MTTSMCHSVYLFLSTFLFFIMLIQFATFASSTNAFQDKDRVALKAFKSMIAHDPQGILNTWNDSRHFCQWEGVTCGRSHRRVTILALRSKGLIGSLSPYIGNLSFLREINLTNNTIQGEIPREFGRLFRLETLFLANNYLVGEIPASLSNSSKLTILSIGRNKLVGSIPFEFISLYKLKALSMHLNKLTGGIPPFIGNLTSLEVISLGSNAFVGNIPDSLGRLNELKSLLLGGNNLSGTIPPSIYNLSFLVEFSVSENQLHGSLPLSLGLTLPNLRHFQINQNFFSGSIPISLSNASKLDVIEVLGNNLSGKLSINFGGMKNLFHLSVANNNLGSGESDEMGFLNSLANCSNLQVVNLGLNQFRGALPHSIANLSSQLQRLFLTSNQLYGSIPSGIGNLVRLYVLRIDNNTFTGSLPEEIGKLRNLQGIVVSGNQLSGEIPSSLGNLSSLIEIYLNNNNLSGVIPSSLGNLKQLKILNLFQNDLSGNIPEEIFNLTYMSDSLNLARNHLAGPIPSKIGNLKFLRTFYVFSNKLSGEIPSELGLCSNLEVISMNQNFFHGSIPQSFSSLRSIQHLDLSRNNLSGKIPKFLEIFSFENLNLSFNNLEGEVPTKGVFANSSQISVAGNSNRLCGGIVELRLPTCNNDDGKKQKISRVFKILISTVGAVTGSVFVPSFIFFWLRKREGKRPSGPMLRKALRKVSYDSLLKATDGFSSTHLIGVGSFGFVYKGILDQDGTVAIKVLNLQHRGASKSFIAECKALQNIRHRNLVKVITACSSIDFKGNDFKALVYEYMQNGNLEKWLHPDVVPQLHEEIHNLTLLQRISIAIDVASALDYLHYHCQKPILHCDLKPSNVLLDNDLIAHVGDFGLARFCQEVSNPNQSSSIGVRGTVGYAAPEYGLGSEASTNGDVYSYGILLLEMVTRKKPTDVMFDGNLNLHKFARMALPDHVIDIADPKLLNDDEDLTATTDQRSQQARLNKRIKCLISMVRIGVACSMESPGDRMNISNVVHELQSIKNKLVEPGTVFNRQRVRA